MTTVITLAQLREAGACKSQLDLFKKRFGESVRVTEELAIQYGPEFDTEWAAQNLLSPSAWDAYVVATASARATYDDAVTAAYAAFAAVVKTADATVTAAYDAALESDDAIALDAAYDAYAAVVTPAIAARDAALVPARVPYAAVSAMAFVRAYLSDC